jgi:hypothetical protein
MSLSIEMSLSISSSSNSRFALAGPEIARRRR